MNLTAPRDGIRFRCSVQPTGETHPGCQFSAIVSGPDRVVHVALAASREQAWSVALAALRGMIALARVRNLP